MELRRRLELKKRKSQKMQDVLYENLVFQAPGPSQNSSKTGPKLVPNRIFDAEALEKPLENLLERS